MIEFLSSFGRFGIVLLGPIALILVDRRGVLPARSPRRARPDPRADIADAAGTARRGATGAHMPIDAGDD